MDTGQYHGVGVLGNLRVADDLDEAAACGGIVKLHGVIVARVEAAFGHGIVIAGKLDFGGGSPDVVHATANLEIFLGVVIGEHGGHGGGKGAMEGEGIGGAAVAVVSARLSVVPVHVMGAEVGNPLEHFAVLLLLDGMVAVADVGVVKRNGAAHGLKVVAAAARCAGVDPQSGIFKNQSIPVGKIALCVAVFQHADAIVRLVFDPDGGGVEVEILTVNADVRFLDQTVDVCNQPASCFVVAKIKQTLADGIALCIVLAQQPVVVFAIQLFSRANALGFKPKQQLYAVLLAGLAQWFQSVREAGRIGVPGARARPVVVARIPARVQPPDIRLHAAAEVLIERVDLILLGRARKFGLAVGHEIVQAQLGTDGLTVFTGENMLEVPMTPQIDAAEGGVLICVCHEVKPWRAEGFTGMQHGVATVLTAGKSDAAFGRSDIRRPFGRPADGGANLTIGGMNCHVGEGTVAGGAVVWGQTDVVINGCFEKVIAIGSAGVAVAVLQQGFGAGNDAAYAHVGDHGGVGCTAVGQINHPLGHGKVAVFDVFGTNRKAALVCALNYVLHHIAIDQTVRNAWGKFSRDAADLAVAQTESQRNAIRCRKFQYAGQKSHVGGGNAVRRVHSRNLPFVELILKEQQRSDKAKDDADGRFEIELLLEKQQPCDCCQHDAAARDHGIEHRCGQFGRADELKQIGQTVHSGKREHDAHDPGRHVQGRRGLIRRFATVAQP